MDIIQELGTDHARETDGVWRKLGDARFLVAGIGSPRYHSVRIDVQRALRQRCQDEGREPTLQDAVDADCRTYARSLLLGWENVTQNGAPLDGGDEEARFRMLRGAPRFFTQVRGWAQEFAPYRLGADEGALGN